MLQNNKVMHRKFSSLYYYLILQSKNEQMFHQIFRLYTRVKMATGSK